MLRLWLSSWKELDLKWNERNEPKGTQTNQKKKAKENETQSTFTFCAHLNIEANGKEPAHEMP